jgi:hypothetical protein
MSAKVIGGIITFAVIAIMLGALIYSLSQVPTIVSDPTDVGNLSLERPSELGGDLKPGEGGGQLGTLDRNITQISSYTKMNSSIGLVVIVLLMVAASVILGAVLLFKHYA